MTTMAALLFSLQLLLLLPSSGAQAEEECSLNTEQLARIHINGSSGEEEELELRIEFSPTALKLEAMNIALKDKYSSEFKFEPDFERLGIRMAPEKFYSILRDGLTQSHLTDESMPFYQIRFVKGDEIKLEQYRELFPWNGASAWNGASDEKNQLVDFEMPRLRYRPETGDAMLLYVLHITRYDIDWWLLPLSSVKVSEIEKLRLQVRDLTVKLESAYNRLEDAEVMQKQLRIQQLQISELKNLPITHATKLATALLGSHDPSTFSSFLANDDALANDDTDVWKPTCDKPGPDWQSDKEWEIERDLWIKNLKAHRMKADVKFSMLQALQTEAEAMGWKDLAQSLEGMAERPKREILLSPDEIKALQRHLGKRTPVKKIWSSNEPKKGMPEMSTVRDELKADSLLWLFQMSNNHVFAAFTSKLFPALNRCIPSKSAGVYNPPRIDVSAPESFLMSIRNDLGKPFLFRHMESPHSSISLECPKTYYFGPDFKITYETSLDKDKYPYSVHMESLPLLRGFRVPDSLKECHPAKFRALIFGGNLHASRYYRDFTKEKQREFHSRSWPSSEVHLVEVFALRH